MQIETTIEIDNSDIITYVYSYGFLFNCIDVSYIGHCQLQDGGSGLRLNDGPSGIHYNTLTYTKTVLPRDETHII